MPDPSRHGIADGHVHLFPFAADGRSWLEGIGLEPRGRDGSLVEYLDIATSLGIDRATLLMHARAQTLLPPDSRPVDDPTVIERIRSYNSWGLEVAGRSASITAAVAVGVDPALMSEEMLRDEIASGYDRGAVAVKYVPASSRTYGDDPRVFPLYEEALRRGMVVVAQSGHSGAVGDRGDPFGRPHHFAAALETFPGLVIVFAHFGEGYEGEVVELSNRFAGVYADLSMQLRRSIDDHDLAALATFVSQLGVHRTLFGSNYPIASPASGVTALDRLCDHGIELDQVSHRTWDQIYGSRLAEQKLRR